METLQTMKMRKSTRKFTAEQISDSDLNKILEGGYCAPVGMGAYKNLQITVVQNKEILNRITTGTRTAFNNDSLNPVYNAPTLIIVSSEEARFPLVELHDSACVIENMHLMATDLGLGSCYIVSFTAAFNIDTALRTDLNIPENHKIVAGLLVGHAEEPINTVKDVTGKIATEIFK